ncbi:hypothetical protein BJ138DRAFT_1184372 [Hygrophoropsis aurantiaca]|uniref:Uncharacterized protein n=1 Tax=Hygrophoropsis aurantiaca TaxID=72124 RepID=A0ACB7ZR87_9AGAM|nr:hypothetical protein BJ138DRAFT_1184372 [Hygrophoropsis aurantiaca]
MNTGRCLVRRGITPEKTIVYTAVLVSNHYCTSPHDSWMAIDLPALMWPSVTPPPLIPATYQLTTTLSTAGISNPTIHDLVSRNLGLGEAIINATTISASCGLFNVRDSARNSVGVNINIQNGGVLIFGGGAFPHCIIWRDQIRMRGAVSMEMERYPSSNSDTFVVLSTAIEDSGRQLAGLYRDAGLGSNLGFAPAIVHTLTALLGTPKSTQAAEYDSSAQRANPTPLHVEKANPSTRSVPNRPPTWSNPSMPTFSPHNSQRGYGNNHSIPIPQTVHILLPAPDSAHLLWRRTDVGVSLRGYHSSFCAMASVVEQCAGATNSKTVD